MPFVFITFLYASSMLATLLLAGLVYWKSPKIKSNRLFLFFSLAILGWLISLFIFYNIDSPELVLWAGRANFAVVLLLLYFLFEFELAFPIETIRLSPIVRRILQVWVFGFFFLTLFTPLVDQEEIITGTLTRETVYGPLFFLYAFNYLIFGGGGLYIILRKLKDVKERVGKYQLAYFVVGLAGALSFAFVTNILLYSFGIEQAAHWGVLAPVAFAGFTTYAIFKYYLFDIKLILTEVLVVIIAFMLLGQIFFTEQFWLRVANALVFGLFCFFGYLLVQGVLREIRLREQLATANTRLRELDAAKTEFVSLTSHQIRTPLTVMKGFLSMVFEGRYGAVPETLRGVLQKTYDANERLVKLIADLLNISRIESGKLVFDKEPTDLAALTRSVVDELSQKAEAKNLALTFEASPDLSQVSLDATRFRQVILNLVDNAIKYTEQGRVAVRVFQKQKTLVLEVKDTGRGMTEQDAQHIFGKFERGIEVPRVDVEGVGLGLYLARKMVEAHGGTISASTAGPGKGSTFTVTLPL